MHRLLGSLLVAAVLAAPAPAHAGWRIDRAAAIARVVWHHPCVDRMRFQWLAPPAFAAAVGPGADAVPMAAEPETCTVLVPAREPMLWVEFCTLTLHEAGHLAGFRDPSNVADPEHSSNPDSVMNASTDHYAFGVDERGHEAGGDPRCADRGQPFLRRHQARGWSS